MTTILIGGDIYPAGNVEHAFVAGNAREIFHELLDDIAKADLSIANLESPLVSQKTPIAKVGPVLGASTGCIQGFAASRWDILNLANNHSFDNGAIGLRETIRTIREAGLDCIGAGENLREAQAPIIKEVNGERIVIYAMAEREFSVADETTPGANPLDVINFVRAVRLHKQDGVFVALVHGGREYYPYPTPEAVRRSRFMVDMGADAVIWCHAHCPLPWETYAGRPIVYGLGNLIFEPLGTARPSWHQGYLARLEIAGKDVRFEPIPYMQSLGTIGATCMGEAQAVAFLQELQERSGELEDPLRMKTKWREFCRLQKVDYLSMLFAYSPKMNRFRRALLPLLHGRRELLQSLLLVQCETHQEILETLFRDERSRE